MTYYTDLEQRQIISDNLKLLIEGCGKDQKQVALDLDVNPPTFNQWATGKAIPQIYMLRKIAQYFHVELTDIINPQNANDVPEGTYSLPKKYARLYSELDDERKKVIHKAIESEYESHKEHVKKYQRVIQLDNIDNVDDAKVILGNAAAHDGFATEEEILAMANAVLNVRKNK